MTLYAVDKLMSEARRIAAEYRRTTGKSLGISAEIARHDACRLLALEVDEDNSGGFDAYDKDGKKIQIKGRTMFVESRSGQRIGQLKLEQDWDAVVLVLMDEEFQTTEIYRAARDVVEEAFEESTRSKRGAMSVARFRKIAERVWARESSLGEQC
ncbi:hypothetical protein MNBD_GAMMA25-2643 [hydrothermal vent metagenome]|uniref:DUF6998 domain-containing protein n=1 Tax=hydrothermal vent metagenome TaxID=652676 RepID=A0A3B1AN29_9ZZZZ